MRTASRPALKAVVVIVALAVVGPASYFVFKASPGFLLGIALAFWADAAIVAIAVRLFYAIGGSSHGSNERHGQRSAAATGRESSAQS